MSRPTSGTAWANVKSWADRSASSPNLSDQDDPDNVIVLAKALVYARTGDAAYRTAVTEALGTIRGTEAGARSLALGRELGAYVLAADLVGYRDPAFVSWVSSLRTAKTTSGPISLVACHEQRPNNWGTHCGASRVIVDRYIGDAADLARATTVFRGWLGDRAEYSGFIWGNLDWQADPSKPVGINPVGATIEGHEVDGVLPDDQRRGGSFTWPPPCENYVHEALQGATLTAALVGGWDWSDRAIVRAYDWLYAQGCPAVGDDRFVPHIVNHFAGTTFPETGNQPGKAFGFSDWLWP
jgi:hypothetical protein